MRLLKNDVLPVIVKDKKGDVTMGTCFRYSTGILTAKHCLEAAEVSIEGYTAEQLQKYATFISKDPNIDLAYIELQEHSRFVLGDANVLDEVLVMSVVPGAGGQSFIMESVERIKELRALIDSYKFSIMINVDGGINNKTKDYCGEADILAAGSYVVLAADFQEKISSLR